MGNDITEKVDIHGRRKLLKTWLPVVVIFLLGLFLRIPTFCDLSCNPDVAGILYSGQGILDGFLPYADSVESKPPGAYFIAAFVDLFANLTFKSFYIFALFWHAAIAITLFHIGTCFQNRIVGFICSALYVLFSSHSYIDGLCPNYETWTLLPLLLSFYFSIKAISGNYRYAALAGLFASFAIQIKFQAVFPAICVFIFFLFAIRSNFTGQLKKMGAYIAAGIVALAPVVIFYLANNKLNWFLSAIVPSKATQYAQENTFVLMSDNIPLVLWLFFKNLWPLLILAFVGFVVSVYILITDKSTDSQPVKGKHILFFLWTFGCIFAVFFLKGLFSEAMFAEHYFVFLVPALCLAGGMGWGKIVSIKVTQWAVILSSLIVIILTFQFRDGLGKGYEAVKELNKSGNTEEIFANISSWARLDHLSLRPMGHYFKKGTRPDQTIYVWDYAPEIYVHSCRRAPSRHYKYWEVVTNDPWGHYFDENHPEVVRGRRQLMSKLKENPPKYIVVFANGLEHKLAVATLKVPFFNELENYVKNNYTPKDIFPPEWGMIQTYELNGQ